MARCLAHTKRADLPADERSVLAGTAKQTPVAANQSYSLKSRPGYSVLSNKRGGVCSISGYQKGADTCRVAVPQSKAGIFCTTCPAHFKERGAVYKWIGEQVLGHDAPHIARKVRFLEHVRVADSGSADGLDPVTVPIEDTDNVGGIDCVLVRPDRRGRWSGAQ
jgi:hypothetical protein